MGRSLTRLPSSPRDPCIQIIPTLGPKVYQHFLRWVIWIPRVGLRVHLSFRIADSEFNAPGSAYAV